MNLADNIVDAFDGVSSPSVSLDRVIGSKICHAIDDIVLLVEKDPHLAFMLDEMGTHLKRHYDHSLRVGLIFQDLIRVYGEVNGVSSQSATVAGYVHDYGKLSIDSSVLHKEGPLDEEETAEVHRHNVLLATSEDIHLLNDGDYSGLLPIVIRHHPYSRRMAGNNGNVFYDRRIIDGGTIRAAYLLRVADRYDALSSVRVYKKPFSEATIRNLMLPFDRLFPGIVEYLVKNFPPPKNYSNPT
ncbi:hypothetical protein COV16_00065 [Candidatus Woesearchaeota archaeon CG10_big_fil_rev_8_21_14_0_10_34_8]|nr:MAG: hypothetical protein COV16_00065 [Candidatus Woesearchaeota archaeon CG10_big_fil_rev_8_21_14_0_10_34_8]